METIEVVTQADTHIKDGIRGFITGTLLIGQSINIADGDDLLLSGLVDSLGVVRLIAFIEEDLGITVPPEDVIIENFQTINAIARYLRERAA